MFTCILHACLEFAYAWYSREKSRIEIVEGRTQRWHIHGYLKVRCFPLGKGLPYVSSHAYVMERITVEVMQWRDATSGIIADCAQVSHLRWNLQIVKQEHYLCPENCNQMFKFFFPHQRLPVYIPLVWYTTQVSQSLYTWMCVWSSSSLLRGVVSLVGIWLMLQTASAETVFSTFPHILLHMFTASSEPQFGLAFRHYHNNRV